MVSRWTRLGVRGVRCAGAVLFLGWLAAAAIPPESQTPAALYRQNCVVCHGPRGEGGLGPQLAGRPLPPASLQSRIRQGGLIMPPFHDQQIPPGEAAALSAWIAALPAPAPASLQPAPPAHAAAAAVFAANCALCHGPQGRGLVGPGILNTPLSPAAFSHVVRHGFGVMPPFAPSKLERAQLDAIYRWLHPGGGAVAPGTVFPLPKTPDYPLFSLIATAVLLVLLGLEARRRRRVAMARQQEEMEQAAFLEAVRESHPKGRLKAQVY